MAQMAGHIDDPRYLVRLVGRAQNLLDSLSINKEKLLLEDVAFTINASESLQNDAVLIFYDEEKVQHMNKSKSIILGRDIQMPCSILHLAKVIREKLFAPIAYEFGAVVLKPAAFALFNHAGDLLLKLTEKESKIMQYLICQRNHAAAVSELLSSVWHYSENAETTTVEAHIYRLKNKLIGIGLDEAICFENGQYVLKIT